MSAAMGISYAKAIDVLNAQAVRLFTIDAKGKKEWHLECPGGAETRQKHFAAGWQEYDRKTHFMIFREREARPQKSRSDLCYFVFKTI